MQGVYLHCSFSCNCYAFSSFILLPAPQQRVNLRISIVIFLITLHNFLKYIYICYPSPTVLLKISARSTRLYCCLREYTKYEKGEAKLKSVSNVTSCAVWIDSQIRQLTCSGPVRHRLSELHRKASPAIFGLYSLLLSVQGTGAKKNLFAAATTEHSI